MSMMGGEFQERTHLEEPPPQGKENVAVSCWVVEELEEVLRLDQEAEDEVPVTLKLPTEDLLIC